MIFQNSPQAFLSPTFRGTSWICALAFILCLGFVEASAWADVRLDRAYEDYRQETQKCFERLNELKQQAISSNLPQVQEQIDQRLQILSKKVTANDSLPKNIQADIPLDLPPVERDLRVQLRQCGEKYAEELYLLARRTKATAPVFAFDLINLVLQFDPDHRVARSMRGFVRNGDQWMTPFERDKQRRHEVNHPRFGWIKHDEVERYEAGERFYGTRWISAEKEALIRQDFDQGWEIETEHFHIKTNVGLIPGVQLGRKLEAFYDYFIVTFAPFYNSPEQIKQLFDSTTGRPKTKSQRYEIHFFRSRDEYIAKLQSRIPQIALTNGLYQLEDRTSYFFFDPQMDNDATIFHEVTHQLMYESHLRQRDVGRDAHFWIIEGIACYMESFQLHPVEDSIIDDIPTKYTYSIGDPRYIRFAWARHRVLEENYYVPLETFSHLDRVTFQTAATEELQRRYSQASGLSHFFMHYADGAYRIALMQYLAQIYHSNPVVQSKVTALDKLTGVSYSELDQQYRTYLQDQQIEVGSQVTGQ